MSDAKLSFNFGEVSFSAEGSAAWVKEQFERALERLGDVHAQTKPKDPGGLNIKPHLGSGHTTRTDLAIKPHFLFDS